MQLPVAVGGVGGHQGARADDAVRPSDGLWRSTDGVEVEVCAGGGEGAKGLRVGERWAVPVEAILTIFHTTR